MGTRDDVLRKARRAARSERILKPLLAFAIMATALAGFFDVITAEVALALILAPALVGLASPMTRGAPSYAELVALIDGDKEVDPIIDALTRKP